MKQPTRHGYGLEKLLKITDLVKTLQRPFLWNFVLFINFCFAFRSNATTVQEECLNDTKLLLLKWPANQLA